MLGVNNNSGKFSLGFLGDKEAIILHDDIFVLAQRIKSKSIVEAGSLFS